MKKVGTLALSLRESVFSGQDADANYDPTDAFSLLWGELSQEQQVDTLLYMKKRHKIFARALRQCKDADFGKLKMYIDRILQREDAVAQKDQSFILPAMVLKDIIVSALKERAHRNPVTA